MLDRLLCEGEEGGIEFDTDEVAVCLDAGDSGRATACEAIEDGAVGGAGFFDESSQELCGFFGGVFTLMDGDIAAGQEVAISCLYGGGIGHFGEENPLAA